MIYLQLFWEFFKTGLFAIGGGMATIPFLREIGTRTGWFTEAALANMLAVAESTPGPMGINMATYVGYTCAGIPGGLVATLGEITPSIIVILIIAAFLQAFRKNKYVEQVFYGMRPASTALIAAAGIGVLQICMLRSDARWPGNALWELVDLKSLLLLAVVWVLTNVVKQTKGWHPLAFIVFSAVVGIVFQF
ncbi:MAG: chromate transporter [Oscillospiraceae bacterium]|nr:chromate transporter [Oscillospiraceae bacterium]